MRRGISSDTNMYMLRDDPMSLTLLGRKMENFLCECVKGLYPQESDQSWASELWDFNPSKRIDLRTVKHKTQFTVTDTNYIAEFTKQWSKDMPKKTAIYSRISCRQQDHRSQMPDLQRWAEAHGEPVVYFKDTFTGRTMDRPGMTKMLEALRAGKLNRIVVWRLDRLGRTTKGLCQLFDELHERSVDLVSMKDGFSLASPAGRLHARILASVAEYETEIRAERVAAGQAAARKKGKTWGGSKKGWRWKVTDEQVNAIHDMKAAGKKITEIARITGLSRPTIYRVLKEVEPVG